MLDIDSGTWQRLSPLLDEALALPPAQRAAWLAARPADQTDLLPWLRELLSDTGTLDWTLPALDDPEAEPWQAGQSVGAYRLLRPLGRGGMGTVWLAQRADLPRPVALKLPRGLHPGPLLARRMALERDLLATLEHPHIARLYDAGVTDSGQPYLALEYVAGRAIDQHCAAQALGVPERLRLFVQAAQAVAHAHSRLIVHRDLKPSNLMVNTDGQVKLLDFGVAKLVAGDETAALTDDALTRAGGPPPMTPEYAAPEQLLRQAVDTRADVYALGVVLFELLTLQRPYRLMQRTTAALEHAVLHQEPPRPSEVVQDPALRRALRGDLDTIVAKALKKNPLERYPTVQALADDVQRHLDHRPVLARPDNLGYVLRRLMRRHRLGFAAGAVAVAGVLAGTGLAVWQAHRAELERQRAAAVSDFFTRLLRDASPYRSASTDWRTQRLLARLLRSGQTSHEAGRGELLQVSATDLLRQAGRQLAGAAQTEPQTRAQLMQVVAEGLAAFGDLPQAAVLVQQALADARQQLGLRHPQTLRLQLAHTVVRRYEGDHDAVSAALAELLPALREQAEQDLEGLVVGLQLAAVHALDRGALAEGLAATEEAERWLTRLPADHPEQVSVGLLRTRALRASGRHQASLESAAATSERAARLFGQAPHPSRVEALVARARAAVALGDSRAGVRDYELALSEARRLVGNDSPLVSFLMQSIVPLDLELGADARAEQRSAEALRLARLHLRPGTYAHDVAGLARAQVLLEIGQAEAALAQTEPALATLRRILGTQHRQVQLAQWCHSRALLALGRATDALQALPTTVAPDPGDRQTEDGDTGPLALRLATARAAALRSAGHAQAAHDTLQPLLLRPAVEGRWHRDLARALAEQAQTFEALQQAEAARTAWTQLLAHSTSADRAYPAMAAQARAALARLSP